MSIFLTVRLAAAELCESRPADRAIFRWRNNKLRPARVFRRAQGAQAVLFCADYKQQGKIPRSSGEQLLRGTNHRRDDSLGVASAAPANKFVVLARRKK